MRTSNALILAVATTGLMGVLAGDAPAGDPADHAPPVPILVVGGAGDAMSFSSPRGIAIDAARREVLVANTSARRIEVFSFSGRRRAHFPHRVTGADGVETDGLPTALALDGRGRLLVADLLAEDVDILDVRGRSVGRLRIPRTPGTGRPVSISVARDGAVFVATGGDSARVHVFSATGARLASWGETGREPGRFLQLAGLAATPDGNVVVACRATSLALQVFTRDGAFLHGFGTHEIEPGNFSLPTGVATTDDGRIWTADEIRQIVQAFRPDGRFLGAVGGMGLGAGEFLYPSALATDGRQLLAVVERVGGRFQLLRIPPLADPLGAVERR